MSIAADGLTEAILGFCEAKMQAKPSHSAKNTPLGVFLAFRRDLRDQTQTNPSSVKEISFVLHGNTVHGNTDTVQRLINALNEDSAENVAVFYINKEKAAEFLRPAGNPISRAAQELDGFIHSINDPGSPVKMRISSETESQQFKRWFGDWQNHPENASKVVNADGTPKAASLRSVEKPIVPWYNDLRGS